jgi:hypothetical protein
MLWSVIVGSTPGTNLGESNGERMQARDVTIPEYRQAISLGLRQEAVTEWKSRPPCNLGRRYTQTLQERFP